MKKKLQEIIDKYHHLSEEMTKPEVLNDQKKLSSVAKEHSSLEKVVQVATEYISVLDKIDEDKEMLNEDDAELIAIAREELPSLEVEKSKLEEELKILLLPKDPNDDKNLILENVKISIDKNLNELSNLSKAEIISRKKEKFLEIGRDRGLTEGVSISNKLSINFTNISKFKKVLFKYKYFFIYKL